jgi:hypothetical protein
MYGAAKIYLKPEVKRRTKVTVGDSLEQSNYMFPGLPGRHR